MVSYITIAENKSTVYKEKGSRFLSFSYQVTDVSHVKTILDQLKDKYFDASHHCYAYRIGHSPVTERANDDREPNGTAGKPILNQLISLHITDVLVVVVRYFGGTLLGASGLTKAYKEAARMVLSDSQLIEKEITCFYKIDFCYDATNLVMNTIKKFHAKILEQTFNNENCFIKIELGLIYKDQFEKTLEDHKHLINVISL